MKLTRETETIGQYFARPDTPSRFSPVGNTMDRILAKYPGISFEDARTKAHELLDTAAKSRIYRGPLVLSAEELAEQKNRLDQAFRGQGSTKALSKTSIPGDSSYMVNHQHQVSRGSTPAEAPASLGTALIAKSASDQREAI